LAWSTPHVTAMPLPVMYCRAPDSPVRDYRAIRDLQ
jgi:hypothetical protein